MCFLCSFCKGLTLYSVVRERGHLLDINKTRQIAQEIVKVGNTYYCILCWLINKTEL